MPLACLLEQTDPFLSGSSQADQEWYLTQRRFYLTYPARGRHNHWPYGSSDFSARISNMEKGNVRTATFGPLSVSSLYRNGKKRGGELNFSPLSNRSTIS